MNRIDLNSDVGESFGRYKLGLDEEVIPVISSANIACGFHAGDPSVMKQTIALAKASGTAPGAHPGLADLIGFGRRVMDLSMEEIRDDLVYQIGALQGFALVEGVKLQHVKPHGALYNMALKNLEIWETIAEAVAALDKELILVVPAGPNREKLEDLGNRCGLRVAFEFFADRAYNPDGSLVSRKLPGAVIHDDALAAQRVLRMVTKGEVECVNGEIIELSADTICVHGDNPAAVMLAKQVKTTCEDAGVQVSPMGEFV
jgi:UPF0271 protein